MPDLPLFSSDDAIGSLARRFATRTLPKAEWTHAAHLAVVVSMLTRMPASDVARDLPPLIRAYNAATGVADTDQSGYHETITLASIRAASAFIAASPARPIHATLRALIASRYGGKDWVLDHWSHACLFSADARRAWREPDLMPLPF